MAPKVIAASGILVIALCAASSAEVQPVRYSPVDYFKNYALSTCIADGYKAEDVIRDSAAAARGYLELGSLRLEAHTEATSLGREFLKRPYQSISGESLTLMKCIDFYHSKELDLLARKYGHRR